MKLYFTLVCALIVCTGALAQTDNADARIGQPYTVTIAREVKRPFVGQLGETTIGTGRFR